jgi:hypothetical protein
MSNDDVYNNFAATGDWMRSALPALESVIEAGVRVLLYNGDAVRLRSILCLSLASLLFRSRPNPSLPYPTLP